MKKFLPAILISPTTLNAAATVPNRDCGLDEIQTDFGCFPNDPVGFVQTFYGYGVGFVGGISLLMLIWGGYTILTSRGEPGQINVGKSYILYAIVGLLLAIFGFVFFQLVAVDILRIPGLNK